MKLAASGMRRKTVACIYLRSWKQLVFVGLCFLSLLTFRMLRHVAQEEFRKEARNSAAETHPLLKDPFSASVIGTPANKATRPVTINRNLRVPTPIFVLSLPKSGTTTTQRYFNCLGQGTASHHWSKLESGKVIRHGECFHPNVIKNEPMLKGCGKSFVAYTDMGAVYGLNDCFYPVLHGGLENIATFYPNATIMLVKRNAQDWLQSAKSWSGGQMIQQWSSSCSRFPKSVPTSNVDTREVNLEWIDFYNNYTETIQRFAREHPSLEYIEVSLESQETPFQLEQRIGISAQCWGDCKPIPFDAARKRRCKFALLEES